MYYIGGYYGPNTTALTASNPYTGGNTNRFAVEVLTGGVSPTAVPTTATPTTLAPTFAPTAYSTTEPWTTKKAMPLSGMEDVGQSCAGVTSATGSFYYQYRGNSPFGPFPATADMMKYTAATDAWSLGTRPSPTLRACSRAPACFALLPKNHTVVSMRFKQNHTVVSVLQKITPSLLLVSA